MSKTEIVIIVLIILMSVLGFKGCHEANEFIQENGFKGVVGELWCGERGCENDSE